MTRKHFIELAEYVKKSPEAFSQKQIEHLADFCKSQNGNFDRARWLGYIAGTNGPKGGKIKP